MHALIMACVCLENTTEDCGINMNKIIDKTSSHSYNVSYENVASRTDSHPVTTKLAKKIIKDSYVNVGKFIKSLSTEDLNSLLKIGEKIIKGGVLTSKDSDDVKDFLLISVMLKDGEGVEKSLDLESSGWFISRLYAFLGAEAGARLNLVKVNYENMTFDTDNDDKPLFFRIV